ncbi:hypothetical protein [Methylocystis sp. SC2]|uniref:hypothetical protein n=1 Tax=Methylocystis sp. (strain SC2) TaxID=187303 RepID=UPI00027AF40F|nr:hypothetical protein [Methylocystis sp. SC2]CCJ08997.1 Uncharacterized protein BN69_3546 [Methylocystis sp. SC2]
MRRYGLGVIFLGLALALCGAYGMWSGWDYIQLERGWSLFIGGATAVSGGVVTMALGRAIGVLGRIADKVPAMQASATADLVEDAPAPQQQQQPVAATPPPKPPVEVDRYMTAGSVYVMFSDGSVEVQTNGLARRYSSLAALRADTGVGGG